MRTERYFNYKDRKSVPHTPDTILSRAKINRPHMVVLVVEGPDDKIALQGVVDEKVCDVEFLEGKQKVFECLRRVNEEKRENIIGLVDSDYDRILKEAGSPRPPSIVKYLFMTDSHDMNTMIIASGALLKMLRSQDFSCNPEVVNELREQAVAITQQIGLVRCLSADKLHRNVRCNFKEDLRLNPPYVRNYIDIPGRKANLMALLAAVKRDLPPAKRAELYRFIIENYAAEVKSRYPKEDLPWQLCQGHDLFSVLYSVLQDNGFGGFTFDEFSAILFDQFGIEEMKESGKNLHQRMKEWEGRARKSGKEFRIFKEPN